MMMMMMIQKLISVNRKRHPVYVFLFVFWVFLYSVIMDQKAEEEKAKPTTNATKDNNNLWHNNMIKQQERTKTYHTMELQDDTNNVLLSNLAFHNKEAFPNLPPECQAFVHQPSKKRIKTPA